MALRLSPMPLKYLMGSSRTHHLRQHAMRKESAYGSRCRRCNECSSRRGCPNQAPYCWFVSLELGDSRIQYKMTDAAEELELDEDGTRISLTIVDTPGFGDQIDNEAR